MHAAPPPHLPPLMRSEAFAEDIELPARRWHVPPPHAARQRLGRWMLLTLSMLAIGLGAGGGARADAAAARQIDDAAWHDWRAALRANDPQALARVTVLPFLYEGRTLDGVQFAAQAAPALFTPARRRCLQAAAPQAEGERRVLWCAPYAFYFTRVDGAWRLAEFAADTP